MAAKRILFSIIPGTGHLNPIVAFARALEAQGHEVRVASTHAFAGAIRAAGLTAVGHGPDWDGREAGSLVAGAESGNPMDQLNWLVETTALPAAEGIVEVAREWRPDLIIRDNLSFGGWLAGDELGIPVVVFALSAPMPAMIARMIVGERLAAARATRGLPEDDEFSTLQGVVTLDTTPPSLADPMSAFVSNRRPLRPVQVADMEGAEDPEWLAALGGRPIIYVTMGTVLSHDVEVFQKIAAAVSALDADVVMTIGMNGDVASLGELPDNVHVARYISQDRILNRAQAVVCHAGRGTVYGALTAGLPLCLVPLGTDQPLVAAACEKAGVAAVCSTATVQMGPNTLGIAVPGDLTVEALRIGIERALTDPELRRRSREVAAEIEAMPSPSDVAGELESLVAEGMPAGR